MTMQSICLLAHTNASELSYLEKIIRADYDKS